MGWVELTVDFLVHVLGFQRRDQLLEIVGCSSTVGGSNNFLGVHAKFLSLGCPRGFDSSDRVGKGSVLVISHLLPPKGPDVTWVTHHVKEDTVDGEVSRVCPFLWVVSRLEGDRVLLLLICGDRSGHYDGTVCIGGLIV